jgi:MFS family permease
MRRQHPLITTLINLKGNPRACVYTEPLWGIPFYLFAPYVSLYMYNLGIKDSQIGLIASIGMAFQIIFSLLGGIITDKMGRKRATLVFDILCWSVPCLIWAISSSFILFVIAAIINSMKPITMISWGCLLVEDSDKNQIVNIYAWVYIAGLLAAFFAPISGIFIGKFELVPTVRVLYLISFVMMTAKFIILNKYATETARGKIRMEETKHLSVIKQLSGYVIVIKAIFKTPETMLTLGIMLIMSICNLVNGTFWSIVVTEKFNIPAKIIGVFPFIRSAVMLIFFFTIVPKIKILKFKSPLISGFVILIISQFILILTPDKAYLFIVISIILEACSLSLINPLLDSMQVVMVDPKERARIIAVLYVIVIALTSPFGYIAGNLSAVDRRLPFIMNITLLILGVVLTYFASTVSSKKIKSLNA